MSAKNLDPKGRFRSKTIAFRVSPEENEKINLAVSVSGLIKQDYIVKKLLCTDIAVQPNPRVYKALKSSLETVLEQLIRIENGCEVNVELLETIQFISTVIKDIKGEKK
ncbi:MAG: hypothetical protein NC085_11125 [Muribaculaceae bacterium]|nr:hypothetical protein [Muribaculaceae bacterium]MCM1480247.1 hypothetical protein [Muribaculaceae bacterium]